MLFRSFLEFLRTPSTSDTPKSLKGNYSRTQNIFRSSPLVVKEQANMREVSIVYSAEIGVCYLLSDILKHLKFINEIMQVYDTETLKLPSTKYLLKNLVALQ